MYRVFYFALALATNLSFKQKLSLLYSLKVVIISIATASSLWWQHAKTYQCCTSSRTLA